MARGAVVVILSDGWDRGDPDELAEEMQRLAPRRPPHRLGQPAEGHARATRRWPGAWPPPCRTLTASSKGHSLAAMEQLADVLDEA